MTIGFYARHKGEYANLALVLALLAVRESSIAKAGADRKHSPMVYILHKRQFAKSLDDSIIVHHDCGLLAAGSAGHTAVAVARN
jgi:hypothetical protein